ncbi:DUF3783 domain-containing protein [Dysosmobacter sp.]|uniref:DUF3783 domain-containing protein n=1 Tax=Dysosmobacter sp. TaxID=2591382 RepID=UPI0026718F90|nr:DUF3783 domain-containing protein [Dysosmobacter sp.]MCI7282080.1 DUF3783 domain-containing protein [Dysosmobacter sp.]
MQKTLFRRIGSGLLSLLMMSTLAISPTLAADSRSESAAVSTQAASDFTITPVGTVTADSTQVTLRIDCADTEVSTVNVFLLPVNTYGYNEDNPIAKKWSAAIGDVTLDVSAGKLTAGSQFCVKLIYTKDNDVREVFSEYFTVAASGEKTREEMIANTSAVLLQDGAARTEPFKQNANSVDVQVKLDDSVESCYMTVYAYIGTAGFDPDNSTSSFVLWKGQVKTGTVTCPFNTDVALKVGYKIIACVNTPAGKDAEGSTNYAYVKSQALEVVDENGQGFRPYTYPDITIDEKTLEPGATTLHISMTGDQRIFDAAVAKKIDINYTIGMYPAGDEFQIEDGSTITLVQLGKTTESITHQEVTLSQPLKAGWRVRAVAYWDSCPDLFIAQGNDYQLGQTDDSVPVSGTAEEDVPTAAIQGTPKAGDTSVTVQLGGKIPDGTYIVLKKYDASTADADCALSGGTFLDNRRASVAGEQTLTFSDALTAGEKLAAFLTNNGQIAKSQPVTVAAAQTTPLFTITPKGALTADSTQITFTVISSDPSITSVGAFLCPVKNGSVDSDHCIARQLGQKLGDITLDIPADSLKDGDVLRLILNYEKNDDFPYYFGTEANNITVGTQVPAEDSVVLNESTFTTDATQATVTVTGCDSFRDGYLILTTGSVGTNGDADSRNRLGSVTFTGPGTYTVPFGNNHVKLISGNTIQAHLYKLDDKDRTYYKYSNAVGITSGSQPAVKPEVSIATDSITADRTNVWVQTSFDGALTGTLKLYTYTGETFAEDAAKEIYSGKISSSSSSQKITFGSGKLTAGQKLIAVLTMSDGTSVNSTAKTVQAAPEKIKPAVQFVTKKVTAGMTKLYAAMTIDSSVNNASYTIYQFTGDTLDISTATALSSGTLYRSQSKETVPLGRGKLIPGAKLQIVLTADGVEARSDVLTVEPSPDWGTPYAAFNVSAVKADAKSVSVQIDYADEYVAMGTDFYCDVTIYQFPGSYSDAEFESKELWENLTLTQRVGQINSNFGDTTRGAELTVPIKDSAVLNAGDRLIIKLRLPHTEWEGEEVDYLSASVPVVGENETVPDVKVVLYNLGEDTSRGARVRAILAELNILAETVTAEQLNETVGHMAGLDGYEAAGEKYTGTAPDTEFMLLCNLPEALLDKFLGAMQTDGLRIDHKAVVTAYNRDMKLHELMGDISEEHDVFQALLELDRLIAQAEKLEENTYGSAPNWEKFQAALSSAKQTLSSQEPTLEQLQTAGGTLKNEYLTLTGMKEMQGDLVIALTQAADGRYTLRAELKNGLADATYQYAWSNGVQSAEITGVTEAQLHTLQVTVSADNLLGSRTAQLQVPYSPAAMAATTSNEITLRWNTPADEENRPAAKTMTVGLYQGDKLIKEQTADAATGSITLTGLSANTAYTLRIAAVSPVGRSDTQVLGVSTAKRSSGGSSSSGSSGSSYAVSVPSAKNGDVTVSPKNASKGDRVTITVKPDSGYEVGSVTVLDSKGNELKLTDKGDGKYTFTMPGGKVEVKATFVKAGETSPFVDVPADSYYFDAVKWAQKLGITNGKTDALFGSNDPCTRGQIVTFLWRAAGSPAHKGTAKVPGDVLPGSYCYDAVAWALENGITNGLADGTFGVNSTCTRGQSVTFLYRALGTAPTTVNGFTDVAAGDFYAEAVAWAVENGVTNGTTDSTFSPSNGCTRAQIVTFLFRTYNQ